MEYSKMQRQFQNNNCSIKQLVIRLIRGRRCNRQQNMQSHDDND